MAATDKNIVITPNIGSTTADPKIVFSGADTSTSAQNITLQVYPTNGGTLSFEGSSGQLFSIVNSTSGTIFSVSDISGIPSIEVLDTGLIKLAQYSGNVLLGTGSDNGTDKLQVNGSILATTLKGTTLVSTIATGTAPLMVTSTTLVSNLNVDMLDGNHASNFVSTTYNSSLNSDSRNSRGVTRLYRRDSDSDYSLQTYWTGSYWNIAGYNGDTFHSGCNVSNADSAVALVSPNGATVIAADSAMPGTANSFYYTLGYGPSANDGHILGMTWSGTSTYGAQVWFDTDPTRQMAFRQRSSTGVWNSWNYLLHDGSSIYLGTTSVALNRASGSQTLTGVSIDGSAGSAGSITNDTSTNADTFYPAMAYNVTSGALSSIYVSSTKLYFNPSLGTLNATNFNSLSDENAKENIATIDNALEKTLELRGVSFTLKETQQQSIGVVAQEIEKIIPEVVSTSNDGVKSVAYGNIVGLLIEAIKEQQAQISSLKQTVEELTQLVRK